MLEFAAIAEQCAPSIHADTMRRLVQVESSFNPYAIGVVGHRLQRQPRNEQEATATARWLEEKGFNYSVGLAQINRVNFDTVGLTPETAFDVCANLRAAASILTECYTRALRSWPDEQDALRRAFSCYYSGDFSTGFKHGYVLRVVNGASVQSVSATPIDAQSVSSREPKDRVLNMEASAAAPSSTSASALIF